MNPVESVTYFLKLSREDMEDILKLVISKQEDIRLLSELRHESTEKIEILLSEKQGESK